MEVGIPSAIISPSCDVAEVIGNLIRSTLDRKPSLVGCKRQKVPNHSRALLKIRFSVVLKERPDSQALQLKS